MALGYLVAASRAAERLDDPADGEALHDLRVAVRRLRSCLRAYQSLLGESVGEKLPRRLRKLGELTGPGRDAEVQLEWLTKLAAEAPPEHEPGARWLAERLERRKSSDYDRIRSEVGRRFAKIEPRLRERLSRYECTVRLDAPSEELRFADVAAHAIGEALETVAGELTAIESLDQGARLHEARLAGKRLRYLIEPWREIDGAREIIRQLKELQDALGELNDLENLGTTVSQALDDATLDRAARRRDVAGEDTLTEDERPGLLALLTRIETGRQERFVRLASTWITGGALERLQSGVEALRGHLTQSPQRDLEIERKYLLTSLPPACAGRACVEIDQGYLPGERLIERLRRKRTAEGVTYVRTVKLGEGMVRIEVEEACTEEVFMQLWPLTEGRRLTKRRYAIQEGAVVWEIDEFTDRELVLAEVELESEDAVVTLPDWLAPHVEREVTGESAYVNAKLAR